MSTPLAVHLFGAEPKCSDRPGVSWRWKQRSGTDGGSGQPEVEIGTQKDLL